MGFCAEFLFDFCHFRCRKHGFSKTAFHIGTHHLGTRSGKCQPLIQLSCFSHEGIFFLCGFAFPVNTPQSTACPFSPAFWQEKRRITDMTAQFLKLFEMPFEKILVQQTIHAVCHLFCITVRRKFQGVQYFSLFFVQIICLTQYALAMGTLQIPQQRFPHMVFGSCQKFFRISPPQFRHGRAFVFCFAKNAVFQSQPKQFHIQFPILSALEIGKHFIQCFKLKIMIYSTNDRIEIKIRIAVLIKGNIHRLQGIILCGVPNLIDGTTLRNLSVFHQRSPNSFP